MSSVWWWALRSFWLLGPEGQLKLMSKLLLNLIELEFVLLVMLPMWYWLLWLMLMGYCCLMLMELLPRNWKCEFSNAHEDLH